ncbi:transcriptional regulator [Paenibacillus helianthi]|uniref:Transcriptional regulator n=1 Tax=Paenibacillus helianthi TaxID=1349432 RepID=A0ABX3ERY4_9BACL|nr:ROK family protein [Paenibacillus helianthi]OKP87504.1 transcriptional regulator [Paenibacillus helianthi]
MNPITNNTIRVKKMNQELVRRTLKANNKVTKAAVAKSTGLSIGTCGSILNELLATGEVLELETEESNGGRPAKVYQYNMDFAYIACIIIKAGLKKHSIDFMVANLAGDAVDHGHEEHLRLDFAAIDQIIGRLITLYPEIQAVGIGVPGAVNHGVMNTSDIEELIGVEIEKLIREKYEIEVILENDMNLTVYGFYHKQEHEEEKSVAVATFIEGCFPGAGMMINGHIHRGSTHFAGEISFLPYGLTREEQFQQLHDRNTFHSVAARAVSSLIAVMNPEMIALTGSLVQPADVDLIRQECLKDIPEMHMPQLTLLKHQEEDYMHGLITMALESLSYSYQLVEIRK